MFESVILAIVLFGILVFIHELGHFLVAKLSNVYVERFALGFGPALVKKKIGETEYAICALPLGGYVKMRGEELDEQKESEEAKPSAPDPRSFASQNVWTRIAIVAMGPTSNIVLPVVLFGALFFFGMPTPVSKIGAVLPDYPASEAGLRAGDEITAVNGQKVWKWTDLTKMISDRAGQSTQLQVKRDGDSFSVFVTPVKEESLNMYGQKAPMGKIGIDLQPYLPVIGIQSESSPAYQSGLRTGDIIEKVNGQEVTYWWQVEETFNERQGETRTLSIRRMSADLSQMQETEGKTLTIKLPSDLSLKEAGIEDGELYLRDVKEGSVAAEKGLLPGDKIIRLNETPIQSWHEFRQSIQKNDGEEIQVGIIRNGQSLDLELIPKEIEHKDELTKAKKKTRQLGVVSAAIPSAPEVRDEQYLNPLKAAYKGIEETVDISVTTVVGLYKLLTGQLGVNTLGGPIAIFYMAGSSYKAGGWVSYIRLMAILSITLAILNFLPIPVLDGGHLFFFIIEAIKGSPVHIRIREVATNIGMFIILGLMILVFAVDINRYFVDKIRSLFN